MQSSRNGNFNHLHSSLITVSVWMYCISNKSTYNSTAAFDLASGSIVWRMRWVRHSTGTRLFLQHWRSLHTTDTKYNNNMYITIYVKSGPKETTQSLQHHNFATLHHRVMRFPAKIFRKKLLTHMTKARVWIQQLNILCFAAGNLTIQKQY